MAAKDKTIMAYALEYHDLGFSVIPIGAKSKKPSLRSWDRYKTERPTREQICKWFAGKKNIAVIMGEVSNGLACRDFDESSEYDLWKSAHSDLARTLPTAETAKGYHVYFRGHCEGIKKLSNGELRGSRCYCVLPPSTHPTGAIYRWINPINDGNLLEISPLDAGFITTELTPQTPETAETQIYQQIAITPKIKAAIERTLPKRTGTRNREIFNFTRELYSMPEYTNKEPKQFKNIVKEWHKRALPKIKTKEFEETWIDFCTNWEKILWKIGENLMAKIFETALQHEPPKEAFELYPDNPKVRYLVSFCRELQRESGDKPFYLSARTAAELLFISPIQASRYLLLLGFDEVIKLIVKGGTKGNSRKASTFRYILDGTQITSPNGTQ